MKITEREVRYVADLANLTLAETEIGRMAHDLDEILGYVGKLNGVDTTGVEPMAQVLVELNESEALRADVEHATLSNKAALANAPAAGAGCFKVPKVIER